MENQEARLENWAVVFNGDAYTPPECMEPRFSGEVYNHPNQKRHYDGKEIVTSPIVKELEQGVYETHSGTVYVLGYASEDYINWVADNYPDKFKIWDQKSLIQKI